MTLDATHGQPAPAAGAPATNPPAPGPARSVTKANDRLSHLFRRSLRGGLVHPLQHLVLHYREGLPA